jgi:hypothetical protein
MGVCRVKVVSYDLTAIRVAKHGINNASLPHTIKIPDINYFGWNNYFKVHQAEQEHS